VPLRGVYIPHFGQISIKISVLGSYTLIIAPMGVKFGLEEGTFGPLPHAKFHPHWCNVSPLRGEKPQNRPLSKLNTSGLRCAQCCRLKNLNVFGRPAAGEIRAPPTLAW